MNAGRPQDATPSNARASGPGRRLWTLLLVGAVLLGAPAHAEPAAATPIERAAALSSPLSAIEARLQALKQRRVDQAIASARPADAAASRFHLGLRSDGLQVRRVRVAIDDEPMQDVAVTATESSALSARRGLIRLGECVLTAGRHRITAIAEIVKLAGDRASSELPLGADIEVGTSGSDWELAIQPAAAVGAPVLALTEWTLDPAPRSFIAQLTDPFAGGSVPKQAKFRAGSRFDPRWRIARQALATDRPFSAVLALTDLDASTGGAADTAALLATAWLAYGVPERARAVLSRAAAADVDLRAEALLALAEQAWQRADGADVLRTLSRVPATARADLRQRSASLKALAEMAAGQFDQAAKTLTPIQIDPQQLLTATAEQRLQAGLLQYNLGVALIRSGQIERGRSLLDRLGRSGANSTDASDDATAALRDRANVALGWHFLREAQGATARPILERVALEGPYSNRALLGLGWAALAPQGAPQKLDGAANPVVAERETPKFVLKALQRRRLINCEEYNRRARAPTELCSGSNRFVQDAVPEDSAAVGAQALVPWLALQQRAVNDAAVQESWDAIPYALSLQGARVEAQRYYEAAIERLKTAIGANDDAAAMIRDRGLISPDSLSTPSGAEPGFAVTVEQARDLLAPSGVEALQERPDFLRGVAMLLDVEWLQQGAADDELATLATETRTVLTKLALAQLADDRQRLSRYLAAAYAGLAALNDPALQP